MPNPKHDVPTEDERITALEATSADHEKRIAALEAGSAPGPQPEPPVVAINATTITKPEGSTGTTDFDFVVSRSGDLTGTSGVSWAVTGSGSSQASAADFAGGVLPSGKLSWAAGEKDKTITVKVNGDTTEEPTEQFSVTLSSPTGGATLGNATAKGVITNEDATTPPPGGEPNASTTGAKGTLTTYTGSMTITADNTVIQDKIINGQLVVNARNVRVINCKITSNAYWGINGDKATGLWVERCTISGAPSDGNSCILTGNNYTIKGCDLSKFDNGAMCGGGTLSITGNYIHDLGTTPQAHVDGLQIAGSSDGGPIDGNSIWSWNTSCVFIKNDYGGVTKDIKVNANWLHNQSSSKKTAYPCYAYKTKATSMTGIAFTNNKIERGAYGYVAVQDTTIVWSGNTDLGSGQPVAMET
jgi:hypothetical protein